MSDIFFNLLENIICPFRVHVCKFYNLSYTSTSAPPSPTLRFDKSLPFIKILPFLGDGEDEKDDDEDDDDEA